MFRASVAAFTLMAAGLFAASCAAPSLTYYVIDCPYDGSTVATEERAIEICAEAIVASCRQEFMDFYDVHDVIQVNSSTLRVTFSCI